MHRIYFLTLWFNKKLENDPQYHKDPEETNKSRKDCKLIIHGHN